MRNARTILTTAMVVGLLGLFAPAALAAGAREAPSSSQSAAAADGYFYAWTGTYRSGTQCRWSGNSSDWGVCRNAASSVENRGYAATYDDVNIYWGTSYTGAWACLGRGNYWLDLPLGRERFSAGNPGRGEPVNDNASSHRWVSTC